MIKQRLALCQFGNSYGGQSALPLSVGCVWAFAKTRVGSEYSEPIFLYKKESISKSLARLNPFPDVLGFSLYIWNAEYSYALAQAVKQVSPQTTIVYGGVHVPDHPTEQWLDQHSEVDFLLHGEGELSFARFLEEMAGNRDWTKVPGLSCRGLHTERKFPPIEELRSPYLDGVFDKILSQEARWTGLQESNRGCVALGAKIVCKSGVKEIEHVLPGDEVLGWNESDRALSWNKVSIVAHNGFKKCFQVSGDNFAITATDDHPFYTQRGWVAMSDLKIGDWVLRELRQTDSSSWKDGVFSRVHPDSTICRKYREECAISSINKTEASVHLQSLRQGIPVQPPNNLFSRMQFGSQEDVACEIPQTSTEILQSVWERDEAHTEAVPEIPPPHDLWEQDLLYGMFKENYQRIEKGRSQPYEECRRSSKGAVECQSTEQIREASNTLYKKIWPAFSLCRRLQILGGLSKQEMPKPGFYSYNEQDEESDFSARYVLASRYESRTEGNRRLRESRLAMLYNLGRRETRSQNGEENRGVCWVEVKLIFYVGIKPVYDLVGLSPSPNFFANGVLVHNCPYQCSFCEWGSSALNKIRQFPMDRVLEEIEWFGKNRIEYIEGADANFGILARDEQIAEKLAQTKEQYGHPLRYRAAFAKYSNKRIADQVFNIAKILHKSGQLKAVTLALQSTDDGVLEAIERKNISMSGFAELQKKYNDDGIPTYVELILGLPGETYPSFKQGLGKVLDANSHWNISIYVCAILPNSEMGKPEYMEKHGLQTVPMRAMLLHGVPNPECPDEVQHSIIATNTMPHEDWKKAYMLSWAIQALHTTGLTQYWAIQERRGGLPYTRFYEDLLAYAQRCPATVLGRAYQHTLHLLEGAIIGGSWDNVLEGFGDVSWPPDEGAFLLIAKELGLFYTELEQGLGMPLAQRGEGPPAIPRGREEGFAKCFWFNRKGELLKELRAFCTNT